MAKGEVNKYYQALVRRKIISPSFIIDAVTKTKSVNFCKFTYYDVSKFAELFFYNIF
jgi:hypothetical protein